MYTPSGSNSTQSLVPTNASNDRVAFDNLLRRELQVGDPMNAQEVANALLRRYRADPRAAAIQQEALGLPFQQTPSTAPVVQVVPTASDNEWKQAVDDVERDLAELTSNTLLKDVMPELKGWTQSLRSTLQAVEAAARFGLDSRQRDKTLSLRRQLSDYARFARLVGTLTPEASNIYRQLAISLDEAAAMALVRIGEALANAGFSGNYLLQAPYSELQTRRDAVIYSLRSLIGATQQAYAPNEWPRGLNAYRKLYEALEQQGQGELRSLLVEGELSRIMDDLTQRAGDGNAEGLRAAGATAEVDLLRFRRLVMTGRNLIRPESPPLSAFLEALQLFADGFAPSGGSRLLRIARPPILLYGLYGSQGIVAADARLMRLVTLRNQLADQLDCFADCGCDSSVIQAVLDLCLHGVDRAIDLYANGSRDFGSAECRASAVAYVLLAVEELLDNRTRVEAEGFLQRFEEARKAIDRLSDPNTKQAVRAAFRRVEGQIQALETNTSAIQPALVQRKSSVNQIQAILDQLVLSLAPLPLTSTPPQLPPDWDPSLQFFTRERVQIRHQELCMLLNVEQSWSAMVPSLTPVCPGDTLVVGENGVLEFLIRRAAVLNEDEFTLGKRLPPLFALHDCPPNIPDLPPQYETLLDVLANDAGIGGENR
jgi:hypothetical protein